MSISTRFRGPASLAAPVRARVYGLVAAAYPEWMTREAVAAQAGIARSLAAFHLDRLAAVGLLEVTSRRLTGRRGPGAGRPSKLYRRSVTGFEVSVPQRDYGLAAEVMARALEAGGSEAALSAAAQSAGRDACRQGSPSARLRELGYEPVEKDGVIRLRNCPFHDLAQGHRGLVCGMNGAFLAGLAGPEFAVRIEPEPGWCCGVLRRAE